MLASKNQAGDEVSGTKDIAKSSSQPEIFNSSRIKCIKIDKMVTNIKGAKKIKIKANYYGETTCTTNSKSNPQKLTKEGSDSHLSNEQAEMVDQVQEPLSNRRKKMLKMKS